MDKKIVATPPVAKEGGRTYRGEKMANVKDFPQENRILVDWFSFTAKEMDYHDVTRLLGMEACDWEYDYGNRGFQHKISYGSVHVHFNEPEFTGSTAGYIWLEMSGQGCRTFETYGNGNYEKLFKLVLDDFKKHPSERKIRPKRIDIAFDDMTGLLDVKNIFWKTYDQSYVSRLRRSECHAAFENGNRGLSVDFGSKTSNVFIRIYDKAAERGFTPEEVPHWVRCELQLKEENAGGFLFAASEKGMKTVYQGVMKNYLSFREPDDSDSNKRRWEESPWWTDFLERALPISVWEKPGTVYNELAQAENYVYNQPVGSIQALIKCYGPKVFVQRIMNQPAPKNPKYERIVKEYHGSRLADAESELADLRREVQETHSSETVQKLGQAVDRYESIRRQRELVQSMLKKQ